MKAVLRTIGHGMLFGSAVCILAVYILPIHNREFPFTGPFGAIGEILLKFGGVIGLAVFASLLGMVILRKQTKTIIAWSGLVAFVALCALVGSEVWRYRSQSLALEREAWVQHRADNILPIENEKNKS